MVGAGFYLYHFYTFLLAQLAQNFSNCFSLTFVKYFTAVFRCKCDSILNHTRFYEYRYGKVLMHFRFCFEGIPDKPTAAAMLRYYRKRKGYTVRQLAEQVGIVPATLLKYEGNQFPT